MEEMTDRTSKQLSIQKKKEEEEGWGKLCNGRKTSHFFPKGT